MQSSSSSRSRFDGSELPFQSSPEVTLGVELEMQIIGREGETGGLAPGALRILDACAEEHLEGVDGEFLLSMIELKTGICKNVSEVQECLFPLLHRVKNIANAAGFDPRAGRQSPFSRASHSAISPSQRYQRLRKRQGVFAYHEALFGLHVHVGVPGRGGNRIDE